MKQSKILLSKYLGISSQVRAASFMLRNMNQQVPRVNYTHFIQSNSANNFLQVSQRGYITVFNGFSSNLPAHMKLEMPNLSPTMEKVGTHQYYIHFIGQYSQMAQERG